MRSFLRFFVLIAAAVLVLRAQPARADVTWTLAGTGDWSVATNWSSGAVPTSTDNADIYNGGTVEVTTTGDVCNNLYVDAATGNSSVQMTAGSLAVTHTTFVGYSGAGAFSQSGGSDFAPYLILASGSASSGTYDLNGGLLITSSLTSGSGAAAFDFGGGTLQASASMTTTVPMTFTGSGGNATVNTSGYGVTLAGSLSGVGGLTKIGSGTLVLSNSSNAYNGNTTVQRDSFPSAPTAAWAPAT